MQNLRLFFVVITLLAATLSPVTAIRAEDINDAHALAGLKAANGVFLVDIDDPNKTGLLSVRY